MKEIVAVEHLFVAEGWLEIHVRKIQSLKMWTKPQFWMKTLTNFGLCVGKTETVVKLLVFKQEVSNSTHLEQVEEFYWLVRNICDIASDSDSNESLYDE